MSIKRVGGPNHNIPWRQYKLSYPICPQTISAGTGIPEEFRRNPEDSGGICRNQGQMQEFTGTCVKFL